jgi:hypothetical protein
MESIFSATTLAPVNSGVTDTLITMVVATIFGVVVALLHLLAHRDRPTYRLWRTLILVAPLIAMSTMAVGTNLAAAFTLFGTLAIVRFRTAIKEPIDAAFVIFSVVIGLATGNQSLIVATVGTAVIAVTIVILLGVKNFGNNTQEGDLRLVLDGVDVPESSWGDVLRAHDLNYTIESCSLDRAAATQSLRINVTGVKAENWPTLLNALLVVPEVQRASGRPLDA